MSRTIVQAFGPIYGEPVNGTVQGRPNGSVYVPTSNIITEVINEDFRYVKLINDKLNICSSTGGSPSNPLRNVALNAIAQDLSSNMQVQIFSDSDLTDMIGYRNFAAGIFNFEAALISGTITETLTDGQTLYIRAQLLNNSIPIATSDVIEVEYVEV